MKQPSAHDVADAILQITHECGESTTNLRLQCLLYLCQGWHLALEKHTLFPEPVLAAVTGPVVEDVYEKFDPFNFGALNRPDGPSKLDAVEFDFVESVLASYRGINEYEVEDDILNQIPWQRARRGLHREDGSRPAMDIRVMRAFFEMLNAMDEVDAEKATNGKIEETIGIGRASIGLEFGLQPVG